MNFFIQKNKRFSLLNREKGLASVEFVIILALIYTPIILGSIEVAKGLYKYNLIARNINVAARYLSVYPTTDANYATYTANAKNLVICGTFESCNSPLVNGLTSDKIRIVTSDATSGNLQIKMVNVSIINFTYDYALSFMTDKTWSLSASMEQAPI